MEKVVNSESLEYKIRTIKLEIKEAEREKDKCSDKVFAAIFVFVSCFGAFLYSYFTNDKPKES
jgi:hypothetical protein